MEKDFNALLAQATRAESAGDFETAIDALKKALALRPDAEQSRRLAGLEQKQAAARLTKILADGFAALEAGRNEAARALYREATAIDPNSQEARRGLEKASSLYLAEIRYSQNLENAEKFIKEGRFPLAGTFFNKAVASRPSNVGVTQEKREISIRSVLDRQSKQVPVTIRSDNRTFVSVIGVLPPDRFKVEELSLYPDVYKVKGARSGFKDVELELKVNADGPPLVIEVIASEK